MSTPTPLPEEEFEVWERWWNSIDGIPGEIVWDADPEALFTAPDRLATALLDATQAIGALHVTKPGPTSRHAVLST